MTALFNQYIYMYMSPTDVNDVNVNDVNDVWISNTHSTSREGHIGMVW